MRKRLTPSINFETLKLINRPTEQPESLIPSVIVEFSVVQESSVSSNNSIGLWSRPTLFSETDASEELPP